MTRAESAVFIERGLQGAATHPTQPAEKFFADAALDTQVAKWATALWKHGYTTGCAAAPLQYCPNQIRTRADGSVFFPRILYGPFFSPPASEGIFTDVPIDHWRTGWVEAACQAGPIPACQIVPALRYCLQEPLDRAHAAAMMARA
jgi:hypothetical protein